MAIWRQNIILYFSDFEAESRYYCRYEKMPVADILQTR